MAGGALDNSDEEISGINVTPLVDIMLVLLIIFMVTATFIANKAIELKLPEADSAQTQKPDEKTLSFAIDREGKLWMDDKQVGFDEVGPRIRAEREKKPGVNLAANISADAKTPYEMVVKLIDIVRKNEVIDFAITTDPVSTPVGGEAAPAPAPAP
ncbi:MAG: biopolymer transporter ExbD [Pseudobdellovibrionaceae bacterium]|uniref:ExbD/TolR family protein n=1 Tax=Oligoflexus sp. TaxID=1971216 RepID=UPI0027BB2E7F|nr:biopolymer transporter ExbD [Oligoflexus sp.]MDQ3233766.1 biopolymer transporter ExbD [Pseudobdellovibrionaceae bacterium]HYX32708.1 biopolymer transporter ExbD [Oligoflexus sp.]